MTPAAEPALPRAVPPSLPSERLLLRPFTPEDAPAVREILAEREIAANTASIPYPYPEGEAERWIGTHAADWEEGRQVVFAVTLRDGGALVGAVGLIFALEHQRAELGYWVGKEFWGRGYATEAARVLAAYGFRRLGLRRIVAHHMTRNPASGEVMRKLGMKHEGTLRAHMLKWGVLEDVAVYGILAEEFDGDRRTMSS